MIIVSIISLLIGAACVFLYFRPRCKAFQRIDENIKKENEYQLNIKKDLETDNLILQNQKYDLQRQNEDALRQLNSLSASIAEMEQKAKEASSIVYDQQMQLAKKQIQEDIKKEKEKYRLAIEQYEQDFLLTMEESASEFQKKQEQLYLEYNQLQEKNLQLQSSVEAAVAAAKRAEEIKEQTNFYKLQLSEQDIEEIKKLREITPYLRDQEPLNKVIWKVYYEKPTSDLIGRVVGSGIHTGIYKITNLQNGKCYVGQSASISDRWKQHIKRGLGADTPTKNKLYPAMLAIGVENFSFEIIEECERSRLDEREDYWQLYFRTKEFGYSIK